MPAGGANIPLEASLKLFVDEVGASHVADFLKSYTQKLEEGEKAVERTNSMLSDMADHVGRIGDGLRSVGGLVGLGSAAAVAQQFIAASSVAMAEGHLTGGAGTYGDYANSLLGVQAQTGVSYTSLEEGLRQVAQMTGGDLSPQGVARFGALIAGASLASGMSSQAISSVMGSFLQSTGSTAGYGSTSGTQDMTNLMAGVTEALSSFQGTQVGEMLPTVASVYEAQSMRSAGTPSESPTQTASFINALAKSNPLFRNSETAEAAIEGANSTLLSGLTSPTTRFAEATAGISASEAIEGGPETIEKYFTSMHERLGEPTYRTWLYSTQSTQTAKMGEELVNHPGIFRQAHREGIEAEINPNVKKYKEDIDNSLAAKTPEAELSKLYGGVMGDVEKGLVAQTKAMGAPLTIGLDIAGAGYLGGLGLTGIRAASGATTSAISSAIGADSMLPLLTPASGVGAAALGVQILGSHAIEKQLGVTSATKHLQEEVSGQSGYIKLLKEAGGDVLKAGEKGVEWLGHEIFGTNTHSEEVARKERELQADRHERSRDLEKLHGIKEVPQLTKELEKRFGEEWYGSHHGKKQKEIEAFVGERTKGTGATAKRQDLDEAIGQYRKYTELGPEGYSQMKFGEYVGKFGEAVEKLLKEGKGSHKEKADYEGHAGANMLDTAYSPLSAAVALHPSTVMAAYLKSGTTSPSTAPTANTSDTAYMPSFVTGVGHWQKLINEAATTDKVPAALIAAVMTQESGGKANALSSAGAEGLLQLMPSTASGLGVRNPYNARENVMGGGKLLSELLSQYHDNMTKTLEAYNGGPGGVGGSEEKAYAASVEALLRKIDKEVKSAHTTIRRASRGPKSRQTVS